MSHVSLHDSVNLSPKRWALPRSALDNNVGVMVAITLAFVVAHNNSKTLFSGAIATMIYEYISKVKCVGTKIKESNLLEKNPLHHMGILHWWNGEGYSYMYMVRSEKMATIFSLILNILTGSSTSGLLKRNILHGRRHQHHRRRHWHHGRRGNGSQCLATTNTTPGRVVGFTLNTTRNITFHPCLGEYDFLPIISLFISYLHCFSYNSI
jgi:hypothetical protein